MAKNAKNPHTHAMALINALTGQNPRASRYEKVFFVGGKRWSVLVKAE